jgi:hypothetical protein
MNSRDVALGEKERLNATARRIEGQFRKWKRRKLPPNLPD